MRVYDLWDGITSCLANRVRLRSTLIKVTLVSNVAASLFFIRHAIMQDIVYNSSILVQITPTENGSRIDQIMTTTPSGDTLISQSLVTNASAQEVFALNVTSDRLSVIPKFLPSPPSVRNKINTNISSRYVQQDIAAGIVTSNTTFNRAIAQMNTWMRHSEILVSFYLAGKGPEIFDHVFPLGNYWPIDHKDPRTKQQMLFPDPVVALDIPDVKTHQVVQKTFSMLKHLRDNYPAAKWYAKLDDDTFLIPSNYLASLQSLDHSMPVYLGLALDFNDSPIACCGGHNSGGSGWTISSAAMDAIYPYLQVCVDPWVDPVSKVELTSVGEDQIIWECLKQYVPGMHATDNEGQYIGPPATVFGKYQEWSRAGATQRPITFHWMSWDEMYALDWLLYHVKTLMSNEF